MKKISSCLIILMFALNMVSAFPLYEEDAVSGATICAGVDLSSPIAAVNRLTYDESPLQSQVKPADSSPDTCRAMCDAICMSQELRGLGSFIRAEHNTAAVSVLPAAASCPAKITMQEEAVRAGTGGSPSLLGYLVVLARANLPGNAPITAFV